MNTPSALLRQEDELTVAGQLHDAHWLKRLPNQKLLSIWSVLLSGHITDERMQVVVKEMHVRGIALR